METQEIEISEHILTPQSSPKKQQEKRAHKLTEIMAGVFIHEHHLDSNPSSKKQPSNKFSQIKKIFRFEAYLVSLLFIGTVSFSVLYKQETRLKKFLLLASIFILTPCIFQSLIQVRELIRGIYPNKNNSYPNLRSCLALRMFAFKAAFFVTVLGICYGSYLLALGFLEVEGYGFDLRRLRMGKFGVNDLVENGKISLGFFSVEFVFLGVNWAIGKKLESILNVIEVKELLI